MLFGGVGSRVGSNCVPQTYLGVRVRAATNAVTSVGSRRLHTYALLDNENRPGLRDAIDHVPSHDRQDHVWCADTTHIPVPQGFFYLVAVMDWASRHVLSWRLSNTIDSAFCVEALDAALRAGVPEIFNTDQGAQFTNTAFTEGCAPTARAVPWTVAGRCRKPSRSGRIWTATARRLCQTKHA